MGRVKDEQLFMLIRNFLEVYLPVYRNAGENTVKTYRAGLSQYLDYISSTKKISRYAVTASMFNYDMVSEYLQWLSTERALSSATCNNRLAVIRAFISYASACKPEYIDLKSRLSKIKSKIFFIANHLLRKENNNFYNFQNYFILQSPLFYLDNDILIYNYHLI